MTPNPPVGRPQTGAWPMYRAMVGVGVICGLLVVSVFQATKGAIERNEAEALRAAILRVLPDARSSRAFEWRENDGFLAQGGPRVGGDVVYAGYDEDGRLVGLAIEADGMGYQDRIRLLYGYSVADQAVIGLRVLESRETPGLGDRIETDASFLENFAALDVSLSADGSQIAHPVEAVKHGAKEHPWQIDGITGATVSSQAVAAILDRSTSWWLPRVRPRLDDFARGQDG